MNKIQAAKPIVVLKALLAGIPVQLDGWRYEWDDELNSIGVECDDGGSLVHFPDGPMSLNEFLRKAGAMSDEDSAGLVASLVLRKIGSERRQSSSE